MELLRAGKVSNHSFLSTWRLAIINIRDRAKCTETRGATHARGPQNTRADASRLLFEAVAQSARGTVRIHSLSCVFLFAL